MVKPSTQSFVPAANPTDDAPAFDMLIDQTIALARDERAPPSPQDEHPHLTIDLRGRLRRSCRWIIAGDLAMLLAAFFCAGCTAALYHNLFKPTVAAPSYQETLWNQLPIFLAFGGAGILWLDHRGHYRQRLPFWEMLGHILTVAVFGFVGSGFVEFAIKDDTSRLWMGLSWLGVCVGLLSGRAFVRRILHGQGAWNIPAVVIGGGMALDKTCRALANDPQMGFAVATTLSPHYFGSLTTPLAWKRMCLKHGVNHIFLALSGGEIERYAEALNALARSRLPFSIVPPWFGLPTAGFSLHPFMLQDIVLLHETNRLQLALPGLCKRAFDLTLAAALLVTLAPLLIALMIGARWDGGPALFRQKRIGKDGRLFDCYKFRSMQVDAEAALTWHLAQNPGAADEWQNYQKLQNDVRITPFGRFIRATSLDELPQLINVFKGDMSLVGPRPCLIGQENFYHEDLSYYTSVRPGITGPWQVSGRNILSFKERVALEAWYVRNWNLWTDIVILLKTFPALLRRDQTC